ncbi:MAG: UDP-N-acetylmuramoyl-L-alanyl-D-glutamate--2,6-diaminopimelate ligase [Proteobacteria bacterium]|nr:UDP-N-acetylmuramoyl-L-alanyl-D-glutamate--2,6-diaminopimelate ligase [Pseudomonadota bacterium]
MKLSLLIGGCEISGITGDPDVEISSLCDDSRNISSGSLFIALSGGSYDGHNFVDEAIKRGACALVVEDPFVASRLSSLPAVSVVLVGDSRKVLGHIASLYYGAPSGKLKLTGITGTNGKTTTAYMLESVMSSAGLKNGLIGTIEHRYGGKVLNAANTTPGTLELQGLLSQMVDDGITNCIMEVSSHALDQQRVAGCTFDVAIFTNLTRDHLDYHSTMEEYGRAKGLLFLDLPRKSKTSVINIDDPFGMELSKKTVKSISYGVSNGDINLANVSASEDGMLLSLNTPLGGLEINSRFIGEYNIYNMMAAAGGGIASGIGLHDIKNGLEALKDVPGRLERVILGEGQKKCRVLVDYAHTPDALKRAIMAVRPTTTGRLITLFGCGGDRDREKRPIMGKVSTVGSDFTIITSDNPRSEDPESIIGEIEKGVIDGGGKPGLSYKVTLDRRKAIRDAAEMVLDEDTLLIAGKGHEDYQIIGGERLHFDDRQEVRLAFESISREGMVS